jgi:signal transduction histidine kinase
MTSSILIADNAPSDRRVIIEALRERQPDCICAETSTLQEALQACGRQAFDCVILDCATPDDDGLRGITLFRERFPHVPVIFVSGRGDETIAAEAILSGAADYIPKARLNGAARGRSIESALEKAALKRNIFEQQEALSNFAHILAHDLKTPLSAVYGFARLLRHTIGVGDPESNAAMCVRIESAAKRMCALIDTLRAYTKAETVRLTDRIELSEIVADALVNLDPLIAERHPQIEIGPLPAVTGHAPLLTDLLQNLIANSLKFCHAGRPKILIDAAPDGGDRWLVSIKDNGIGIPQENWQVIFEPFAKVHPQKSDEGMGLGLAICKKIVQLHGGRISCESEPGAGTVISFSLPCAARRAAAERRDGAPLAVPDGLRG